MRAMKKYVNVVYPLHFPCDSVYFLKHLFLYSIEKTRCHMMKFRNFSERMENDDITKMKVLKQTLLLSSHDELKLLSNSSYICMRV